MSSEAAKLTGRRRHFLSRAALLGLALAIAGASSARAQVCTAASSFRRLPYRVDGTAAARSSVAFFGGGLAVGSEGAFGSVGAGLTRSVERRGWGITVRTGAGYQLLVDARSRVQVCPTVDLSFVFGPDSAFPVVKVSYGEVNTSFGVSIGAVLHEGRRSALVLAAALALVRSSQKLEDPWGQSDTERSTSGVLSLAAGLVVRDAFTLRPSVALPLGEDRYFAPIGIKDGSTHFAVTLSIGFGPTRP